MPEVTLDQAPQQVRDLFNKGFSAFERGNLDYAIDMLLQCVEAEPGLLRARKFLRAAQVQRVKRMKQGAIGKLLTEITSLPQLLKVNMLSRSGKGGQAIMAAETLLCKDPLNLRFLHAFSNAADKAGQPEAAIQTMEIAKDHFPDNLNVLEWLGDLYVEIGNTRDARACFDKLSTLRPNDPDVVKKLKDALAMESMDQDGWQGAADTGGTFREIIRDTEEATTLERESKAVKSDRDADSLIENTLKKIEAEPGNVNYYRALARLYVQRKMFDEAIETLGNALQFSPGDPELDQTLSNTKRQKFDHEIEELRGAGDEEGAAAKQAERDTFVLEDLKDRVKRYPNDMRARYELGEAFLEMEQYNEAIQQFQLAQRNPKYRSNSLFYLGICLKAKGQYDMALTQLEAASSELVGMDETKKTILYEMGEICELTGRKEDALTHYKAIYQVDIGFRDVAQKIERAYEK